MSEKASSGVISRLSSRLRSCFRYRLRTLFIAVGVFCVWLGTIVNRANEQKAIVAALISRGGIVWYDYDAPSSFYSPKKPVPSSLLARLGKDYAFDVVAVECAGPVDQSLFDRITSLRKLERLSFHRSNLKDIALGRLSKLPRLRELNLFEAQLPTGAMEQIKTLSGLEKLNLGKTQLDDAGLMELRGLTRLESLAVPYNEISDTGLQVLSEMKCLQILSLTDNAVTGEGLAYLPAIAPLESVGLTKTKATDEGLRELTRFPGIKRFSLSSRYPSDEGARSLSRLPNLQYLHLFCPRMTMDGLKHFKLLNKAQVELILDGSFDEQAVAELRKDLPTAHIVWSEHGLDGEIYREKQKGAP